MLHGVNPDGSWNIGASKTGYFVIFASAHGIFSEDFAAIDEYHALRQAYEICGHDWEGWVTVDDNSKLAEDDESEPILSFKHTRQ